MSLLLPQKDGECNPNKEAENTSGQMAEKQNIAAVPMASPWIRNPVDGAFWKTGQKAATSSQQESITGRNLKGTRIWEHHTQLKEV